MTVEQYKNRFNNYYQSIHKAWKESPEDGKMTMPSGNESKAIKDAVGKWYEQYRNNLLTKLGFEVNEQEKFMGWDADQVIRFNGKIVAVEDDKAQLTTGSSGVIMTFLKVIDNCLKENKEVPYLILSSANLYTAIEKNIKQIKDFIKPEIWNVFEDKFRYFSVTNKGRANKTKYIRTSENPFELDNDNIKEELNFFKQLKK